MPLGAYSIVRFSDNLSDQRVNLGVLVWHPDDGLSSRFTSDLTRVHAIDPQARVTPLKQKLSVIREQLDTLSMRGDEKLRHLAAWFRDGLEVTAPYPARMFSAEEMLVQLYERLVSPVDEFRRASSQRQFESAFKRTLRTAVEKAISHNAYDDIGVRKFGNVHVDVGVRVRGHKRSALWRAVSLQSQNTLDAQLAKAKSVALDINVISRNDKYKNDLKLVALQPPKPSASEGLDQVLSWLKNEADDVVLVRTPDALEQAIEPKLHAIA